MSLVPPILVPSSLYTEEAKRDSTRIRIYNNVLQHIYNKIKAISRIPGNEKSLWYVVPEFIPGTPRFDIGDAILYIVWNLRNLGYKVEYTHPNLLFISWKAHDDFYRNVESPMSQVLNAVRGIASTYKIPTTKPILKPSLMPSGPSWGNTNQLLNTTASAKIPDITKRKTPLKKTVEFRPDSDTIPAISKPASLVPVANIPTAVKLPGQLSERHVSFV
jgi:hypothetical protein